ncbi:MAG: hemerythrin domain-containing protein [Kiritimatiellia bacterium]
MKKALEFVLEYVEFHFGTEERLMHRHGYPEAGAHKRKHADFREEIGRLRQRFLKTGLAELRLKLSGVLVDWLRSHIPTFDRRLVNFLKTCMTP